jgi:hypothetical protein
MHQVLVQPQAVVVGQGDGRGRIAEILGGDATRLPPEGLIR